MCGAARGCLQLHAGAYHMICEQLNPPKKWCITTGYMMQVELMNNGQEECSSIPITARSVGLPGGFWLSLSSAAVLKILAYRSTLQ